MTNCRTYQNGSPRDEIERLFDIKPIDNHLLVITRPGITGPDEDVKATLLIQPNPIIIDYCRRGRHTCPIFVAWNLTGLPLNAGFRRQSKNFGSG